MTPQDVTVEFYVSLRSGEINEESVTAAHSQEPDSFAVHYQLEGGLRISCGGAEVELDDTLFWMIPALCFDATVVLQQEDSFTQAAWSNGDEYKMRREADRIIVEIEDFEPLSCPDGPLQAALLAAGKRFITAAKTIWPDAMTEDRNQLHARCEAAEAALLTAS
ncbi:MAG: hypothetical protein HRU33_23935 [Rhodobacteraceae bacterium]|nr:hypothetical protein [Paracoccaceae bacterium]